MTTISNMTTQTLSLFGLRSFTTSPPRLTSTSVSAPIMRDSGDASPASPAKKPPLVNVDELSSETLGRLAHDDPRYEEAYAKKLRQELEEDSIRAYAKHAKKQAFLRENGYRNELTSATYHAVSVTNSYTAGEKQFDQRWEAVGEAASRIGQLMARVRNVNDLRDYAFVAVETEPDRWMRVVYDFVDKSDVAAQSEMSPQMKALADRKMAHDLIATDLNLQIDQGMMLKDFGVSRGVVSRLDDGRAALGDFEITHSQFGKIAEYRNGEVYVFTEEHGRETVSEYERRRAGVAA